MSDSETTETQAPSAPAKKSRSKLLLIGLPVLVVLGGGGAGGWWYMQKLHAAPAAEEKKVEEAEATGLLPIDPFTVNLADPGGRRYLRIAIDLVVPDEAAAKKITEEEIVMSRIRSELLELLASRTAADLATPQGRAALKKSIAETSTHAGHLDVRDVLLKEFVVQ